MSEKERLLLVDSNSLLNRAFYGLAGRSNLTAPDGTPSGALYAFLNMIFKYMDMYEPDYAAAAFDLPGKTFRHLAYEDYKAGRKAMPDDLALQFPIARDLLKALGFTTAAVEEYEADDIIGTMARMGEEAGVEVIILSGDRDLFQLISPQTKLQFISSSKSGPQTELVSEDLFFDYYGVTPSQWVDVKALMGDSSDNIPGIKGIGQKTALKLIKKYGSLDEIYKNLDKEKGALKKKLEDGEEVAELSYNLSLIEREVDLPAEVDPMLQSGKDFQDDAILASLFSRLGFNSYWDRFPEVEELMREKHQGSNILQEAEELEAFSSVDELITAGKKSKMISFFLGKAELPAIFLTESGYILLDEMKDAAQLLKTKDITFITWDIKQQLRDNQYILYDANIYDLMIAAYLLHENTSSEDFDYTMHALLGEDFISAMASDADLPLLADQNDLRKKRAYQMFVAYEKQREELDKRDFSYLVQIEMDLAKILAAMEIRGVAIDKDMLEETAERMEKEIATIEESIFALAGKEFNVNSPQQLSKVLFEERNLPPGKKTASGYSTAADELQRLYYLDPIIPLIMDYREISKLHNTFVEGLLKEIGDDGRVHSYFNQTVTSTGRLSSSSPNLQNIPIRTERGREIRKAFVAPAGRLLVGADYSQIELRLLAHLSQDDELLRAFRDGEDIHKVTAANLFQKDIDEVTADERAIAKTVNFSITYGISEYGLSRDLGTSMKEAGRYIDSYHKHYPKVVKWLEKQAEIGKEKGYVETLFKRRRYLPELSSQNRNVYHFGERAAMNAPVQGTAADLIKIAMVKAKEAIQKSELDAQILLQVHDELILEVAEAEAEEVADILKEVMENAMELDVPLIADTSIGPNWGEMK